MTMVDRSLVAFALEQVLGHVSQAQMLKRHVPDLATFEPLFIDVNFEARGGFTESLPLPAAAQASLRARREIRNRIMKRKPDAFVFNTQKPALFCPEYLLTTPSVITLDVTPRQYDEMGARYGHVPDGRGAIAWLKHRWNEWVFQRARNIFPASRWAAESLIVDYGVQPHKIRVIPPGVDVERWRPAARGASECVRILFVGGDFGRKGGRILLDWFRHAPEARSCELHIVTRSEAPAGERIHVYRAMGNNSDELVRLAQSCDIFALPTLADCFSLASLEAMAAGLPVVVSATGGIPDIFEDGTCGFMPPPGDAVAFAAAMRRLVCDSSLRLRMGLAARARVEEAFDARTNVRELVDEVQQLLAERASAASGAARNRDERVRA